jgi:hypothetical protein
MIAPVITFRKSNKTKIERQAGAYRSSRKNTPYFIHRGYYPKKLYDNFKLEDLPTGLYILMQKAVTLNTCRVVRKLLAE